MAESDRAIDALIGEIAEALLSDSGPMAEAISRTIAERLTGLAAEPAVGQEIAASTRANVGRFLHALALNPGQPVSADVPPEALDLARTFVRRGIDLETLAHVYRWGQNAAWQQWMAIAIVRVPPALLPAVLDRSSTLLFGFVDGVLAGMSAQVEHERAQLLGGAAARREQTVRLLLEGAPVAERGASQQLGYALDRDHTAFVIWSDPGVELAQGALERVAEAVGVAAGARALTVPMGRATLWAWVSADDEVVSRALATQLGTRAAGGGAPPGAAGGAAPRVAVGGTHRGIPGFRRSHEEAVAAQRLLLTGSGGQRLIAHRDVEVITLMADDRRRLDTFVVETLGPLGGPDRASRDLAETVRIYLQAGDNAAQAAARLGTHRNTVLQRIARAERLLGHPVTERRLPLLLALEAAHHLGVARSSGRQRQSGLVPGSVAVE